MRILVIQLRRVGDILLTTPAIQYLRQLYPNDQIDILTEPMGKMVLETNSDISTHIIYDKSHPIQTIRRIRDINYDLIFDFINTPRSAYVAGFSGAPHRIARKRPIRSIFYSETFPEKEAMYGPLLKIDLIQTWRRKRNQSAPAPNSIRPKLFLSDSDRNFAREWMRKENLSEKGYVVINPVHRHPIRQWRLEGFTYVGKKLFHENGLKIYLAWGPGEEKIAESVRVGAENEIKLLPPTTFRQMGAIFEKARFCLTNDSGPMHTAIAVGAPTATIYGPTRPLDWNPRLADPNGSADDIIITASDVACLGCHLGRCPVGHLCMTHLKNEDVYKALTPLLN